jgi:hypothetical protein
MCDVFRRPCCLCRHIAVAIAMCVMTSGTARSRCDVTLFWCGTPIQPKYKTPTRQQFVQKCLKQCYKDKDIYLSRIITSDETWVHHCDPLMNNQWNGIITQHCSREKSRCRLLQVKSWPSSCGTVKESC